MYRNKAPTVQISTFGNAPSNQSHVELLKKKRSHAATSDLPYVNSAGNGSGSNLSTKRTRLQTSNQECQTFVANGLNSSSTVVTTERTTTKNGRSTGPYAEMFANKIGYTIRNYAPLNVEKWKKIEKADVKNLIKRMQATQTGEMQGAIDRFETEYRSTKKGWDLGAKEKLDQMIKMRAYTTQPDGTRTMTDEEIYAKVLKVKSGYIKGCGFGPRPPPLRFSRSSMSEMSENNKDLQEQLQETQQLVGTQQQKIDAQNKVIQRLEEQAKKFEEFMANFFRQHPSA